MLLGGGGAIGRTFVPATKPEVTQLSISVHPPDLISASGKASVSIVMPTPNKEQRIPGLLCPVSLCVDEVVILDRRSTDDTVRVARAVRGYVGRVPAR